MRRLVMELWLLVAAVALARALRHATALRDDQTVRTIHDATRLFLTR